MASAGAVLAAVLAIAIPSAAADTPVVSLSLSASPDSLPQGERFGLELAVSNAGAAPEDVTVRLGLVGPGGGEPLYFDVFDLMVAPGITERAIDVIPAQWFAETGSFEVVVAGSDGSRASLDLTVTAPERIVPRFEDVTAAEGVGFAHSIGSTCNGAHTAGAAWADVEGDGDLDLYVPDQRGPAHLFINGPGGFADEAAARGADNGRREGYGASFADVDNDGDPDLFVANHGADRLYINDGSGRFTDRAPELGLADSLTSASGAFADFDGDGRLDLYVARWGGCIHEEYTSDSLYRQRADGTFADVTGLLPGPETMGRGFLGGFFDYDLDEDPDLYLANDFTQGPTPQPNALWRNDGGAFTNVSAASGTGIPINSMGLAIGDYDGDGDPDVSISNMGATVLFQNEGDSTFTDVAEAAGVDRPWQWVEQTPDGPELVRSLTWGLEFSDLNNDSLLDLFVTGGEMFPGAPVQPNEVFVGTAGDRFLDLSAPSGAHDSDAGRGVALADYDSDGRVDLYIVNRGGEPRLYRNVTPREDTHWLEVETRGTESSADGCGARVRITAAGRTRSGWVHCGSTSLGSGSDKAVHFGLGDAAAVERLRVDWPSGQVSELSDVGVDRRLVVTEPELPDAPGPGPGPPDSGEGPFSGTCGSAKRKDGVVLFPIKTSSVDCAEARAVRDRYGRRAEDDGRAGDRRRAGDVIRFGEWTCDPAERAHRGRVECAGTPPRIVSWRWREAGRGGPIVAGYAAEERWISIALDQIAAHELNPPRAARLLAHLSSSIAAALRDAQAEEADRRPLPRPALLAGSATPILAALLPAGAQAEIDRHLAAAMRSAKRKPRAGRALAIGDLAAATFVRRTELDGGSAVVPAPAGGDAGEWVPTPPAFATPLETGAGGWELWNLRSAEAAMPAPPPAYGSDEFAAATEEIYEISQTLSERQREIALFWADGAGTATPPGHWNQIALELLARSPRPETETARIFEALNTAQADAFIVCWAAKYRYNVVRPITEIRRLYDSSWNTAVPTPPFPAYPSGHSSTSNAAATVLGAYFPADRRALKADAREAGMSRLYGGIHYGFDNEAGATLGEAVAKRALARFGP